MAGWIKRQETEHPFVKLVAAVRKKLGKDADRVHDATRQPNLDAEEADHPEATIQEAARDEQ
jgi:hypothetical protein